MKDNKLQIGIYKIDETIKIEDLSTSIIDNGYSPQEIVETSKNGYDLSLYYLRKNSAPKWKDFFHGIAEENEKILQKVGKNEGFIMLLCNESIYSITGGLGFFSIQNYIDSDFGIDIISRLIKKDEKIIKSTKENSVVGGILGSIKYFRTQYNLFENDSFGKIYQELKTSIEKDVLIENFGFTEEDIKKDSICIAKSSFKINKAINFDQLLTIIDGCEAVLEKEDAIVINAVRKIVKKKNENLIEQLTKELMDQIWQRYIDEKSSFKFDLCHKDFEKYLTASKYEIRKNQSKKSVFPETYFSILDDIDILFKKLKEFNLIDLDSQNAKEGFCKLINSFKIFSFDEEGLELTKWPLIYHIFGDVEYQNKRYFYINNVWYLIEDDFINALNDACNDFTSKNWYSELGNHTWDYFNKVSENGFNKQFIGNENTIVLDKITPENIEPCDILKWDEDNLYLLHVKAGFGNTMRDLCSQVLIASNRILQDLNGEKSYINKIYDELEKGINSSDDYFKSAGEQTFTYTKDEFQELFNNKNLVFVLAIFDSASSDRDIRFSNNFRSNIAKFSLQELVKDMKALGANLKITQILRPQINE